MDLPIQGNSPSGKRIGRPPEQAATADPRLSRLGPVPSSV